MNYQPGSHLPESASTEEELTTLRRSVADLKNALHEQETLFRELSHRVKNNLQLVSSMISLQATKVTDPDGRAALEACLDRVYSVGLAHDLLSKRDSEGFVDLHQYLTALCERIARAYMPPDRLTCEVEADRVNFSLEITTRLALVVNEVVTNAVKHAFPHGRSGTVTIVFRRSAYESKLMIADDGIGMSERPTTAANSLGLQLVETLAHFLKGTFQYQSGEFGTVFTLSFHEPRNLSSKIKKLETTNKS